MTPGCISNRVTAQVVVLCVCVCVLVTAQTASPNSESFDIFHGVTCLHMRVFMLILLQYPWVL